MIYQCISCEVLLETFSVKIGVWGFCARRVFPAIFWSKKFFTPCVYPTDPSPPLRLPPRGARRDPLELKFWFHVSLILGVTGPRTRGNRFPVSKSHLPPSETFVGSHLTTVSPKNFQNAQLFSYSKFPTSFLKPDGIGNRTMIWNRVWRFVW